MQSKSKPTNKILVALFCFVLSALILTVGKGLLHILERVMPTHNKIEDFQLSDICMAYGQGNSYDTSVVIVDCSKSDRKEIAEKIEKIVACSPTVIGIDVTFNEIVDSAENVALIRAIENNKDKIVLVNSTEHNSVYCRLAMDGVFPQKGYIVAEPDDLTLRTFIPFKETDEGGIDTFFAVRVALAAKKEQTLSWIMHPKGGRRELVNFKKGFASKLRYDVVDVKGSDTALFRNKIVLIGTLSDKSEEDKHYSPLSGKFGRGKPDMFGVEYHAQIISMIENNEHLKPLSIFLRYLLIFGCCIFIVQIDAVVAQRWHKTHHLIMHMLFVVLVFLFLAICIIGLSHHLLIEPVDYIIPMIISINIIPLYDLVSRWIYMLAKKIVVYYEKGI